jgi:hypothetical protein
VRRDDVAASVCLRGARDISFDEPKTNFFETISSSDFLNRSKIARLDHASGRLPTSRTLQLRMTLVLAVGFLATVAVTSARGTASVKPHIIQIVADDLG